MLFVQNIIISTALNRRISGAGPLVLTLPACVAGAPSTFVFDGAYVRVFAVRVNVCVYANRH